MLDTSMEKMLPQARRARIIEILKHSHAPVRGSELAQKLGVSRQVIVGDMQVLRASGIDLVATANGYLLSVPTTRLRRVIKVCHRPEETEKELSLLVEAGVRVVDVIVPHAIYGEIRGPLLIETADDVRHFSQRTSADMLLSPLAKGVHYHTIDATTSTALDAAISALQQAGFLLEG